MLGVRTLISGLFCALVLDMFEARLHEGTITFGFWLVAPPGWEPEPSLASYVVHHATRQLESQYQE